LDLTALPSRTSDAALTDQGCVLVVEDDGCLRALIVHYLVSEGYTVREAEDGNAAIQYLRSCLQAGVRPGLVLLDLMLPETSGLTVLQLIRAVVPDLPVFVMSISNPLLIAATDAGASGVLIKPFDLDQMLPIVARYCDQAAA
jgi:CheY-like chemotaxis protein